MDKYPEIEGKIAKTLEVLSHSYATIRAGRANAAVLDRVSVDYYGTPTPVGQIASVSTPEPRILVIQPWDASALKNIEKAIQASDLGINPTNDGKVIRLAFPQLTEERRRELGKQVHKYGEEAKVAVRSIRRDAIELYKKQQKKSEITEDDLRDIERDLQEMTDKAIKDIDALTAKKEKELMEV
ncbi:MAG: ribosome recycling factor [Oscillospiraceae bacterium]|jgi:ribosome recycling factor|nr:ribosome recycling factor [Oscillospiraceae bacterium]